MMHGALQGYGSTSQLQVKRTEFNIDSCAEQCDDLTLTCTVVVVQSRIVEVKYSTLTNSWLV